MAGIYAKRSVCETIAETRSYIFWLLYRCCRHHFPSNAKSHYLWPKRIVLGLSEYNMRTSSLSTQLAWRLTLSVVFWRPRQDFKCGRFASLGSFKHATLLGHGWQPESDPFFCLSCFHTTTFTFSIFSLVELVGLKIGKKLLSWYAKCPLVFPSRGLKNVACLLSLIHIWRCRRS